MHWLNDHPNKEAVYAVMRELGAEIDRLRVEERKLMPKYGEIAAGGGAFDFTLKIVMREAFLQEIRWDNDPVVAAHAATEEGKNAVRTFNSRHEWQVHRAAPSGMELREWVRKFLAA